jgi:sulfatase modifying factor 1
MDANTDMVMIAVPAGRVTLADRRAERTWTVEVEACRLGAHPVTQAQYAAVTGAWPSPARGDRLPVVNVSWWEAVRFCNVLSEREGLEPAYRLRGEGAEPDDGVEWNRESKGYRLPAEAEWEHACRAGTSGPRYGALEEIAWYRGNSGERIREVGGRRPNRWGLHDMLGNVWEWCWELYDPAVYGTYRVLRGGGWFDEHWSCRASVRRRSMSTLRIDDLGFRVARSG